MDLKILLRLIRYEWALAKYALSRNRCLIALLKEQKQLCLSSFPEPTSKNSAIRPVPNTHAPSRGLGRKFLR